MTERTWTISNALSLSRIVLVVPIVLLLLEGNQSRRGWAVVLMSLAALTDLLDGTLARALRQETTLGKMLDPIADKVAVTIIVVVLAVREMIPLWFLCLALARDIVILTGGLYVKKVKGVVLQSNMLGKWTVTAIAAFVIFVVMGFPGGELIEQILLMTSTVMIVASSGAYARRFREVMKET